MDDARTLYEELGKYFIQLIKQQNIPMMVSATVVSYSSPNAVINIAGSTVNITVPNLSGQTLSTGNVVECIIKNGSYSNMFIAFKR